MAIRRVTHHVRYGNGDGELVGFVRSDTPRPSRRSILPPPVTVPTRGPERPPLPVSGDRTFRDEGNRERADRRARQRIRRYVRENELNYMVVLTPKENILDYRRALRGVHRWERLVRDALPGRVWLRVAERQKRGAWHFHYAVHGWQPLAELRACLYRAVGKTPAGIPNWEIHVEAPPAGVGHEWGVRAIYVYLCKYLAKDFTSGEGRHRYSTCEAGRWPEIDVAEYPLGRRDRTPIAEFLCAKLVELTGRPPRAVFVDERSGVGWATT